MMNNKILLCFLLLILTIVSCKKQSKLPPLKAPLLTSFSINKENNPNALAADIKATIEGANINISIPENISVSRFVPAFAFEGKKITIDGIEQVSAFTSNDFSKPLVYEILGEDDTIVKYTVKVNSTADEELAIKSLTLEKANNLTLANDIGFTLKGDSLLAKVPIGETKIFKPSFVTTAKEVLLTNMAIKSGETPIDFSNTVTISLVSSKGFRKNYFLKISWQSQLPHVYINTSGGASIVSKDNYLTAQLIIDGKGAYADINTTTSVKGRGNSTWGYPKKPYRLKLDNKTSLFGLPKAKNWVLLANYLDGTLMLNAVALKTGQLLNIPFTNNFVPVDLTINNQYMGSYLVTEQVEVDENRVNIATGGVLLEMDSYFDETYKFKSTNYQLPINIKYPDLTAQSEVAAIQQEFQVLEDLVFSNTFPNNNYLNYIDKDILVNFLIVANLTDNEEISHPKSTYLYKAKGGKYAMGPLWDFDWAYGYEGSFTHFASATRPLFNPNVITRPGYKFFTRLLEDPVIKTLYKQKWNSFKADKLPILLQFVDDYSKRITTSKNLDYVLWKRGDIDFTKDVAKLKQYLNNRATYIDSYVASF